MGYIRKNIDTITTALTALTALFMAVSLYMVFIHAPMEQFMKWPQKIFYFHVPIAIMCYAGFFITFVCSIGYLWSGALKWDSFAVSGAEVGLLFANMMLVTGMLWGRPIWGAYWTWDPRLTTSFIMWLIFAGYLILRSQVDDEVTRAKYAAVMGIIGFADVPLVHYSVKLWSRGIHPVIDRSGGDAGMHPDMLMAFKVSFVAILLLFVLVFIQRVRYEFLRRRVETIKSHKAREIKQG